jgi:hypothetical protein
MSGCGHIWMGEIEFRIAAVERACAGRRFAALKPPGLDKLDPAALCNGQPTEGVERG